MKWLSTRGACLVALALCTSITAHAQAPAGAQAPTSSSASTDPRVGLKPGFRDAGEVARNMRLVASLPKPEGFFDPAPIVSPHFYPTVSVN